MFFRIAYLPMSAIIYVHCINFGMITEELNKQSSVQKRIQGVRGHAPPIKLSHK